MRKRPKDPNQLAYMTVQIASGQIKDEEPEPEAKRPYRRLAAAMRKLLPWVPRAGHP